MTRNADTTYDFTPAFGQEPLLSAADEIELAGVIAEGKTAEQELERAGSADRETARALMATIRRGKRAQDRFINANARLVLHHARKYVGCGLEFPDLVQEGNLGLMKALSKFDASKGYRFSTYASAWIRQYLSRAISNQARNVRVPEHQLAAVRKLAGAEASLAVSLGRDASTEELTGATGFSPERIDDLRAIGRTSISLSMPVGDDGAGELGDLLVDEGAASPTETAETRWIAAKIAAIVAGLPELEAAVLTARHGLDGSEPGSLDEVAAKLSIPRSKVRSLESAALARLRHPRHAAVFEGLLAG